MSEVPPSDSRDGPDPLSMFLQFLRMQHLRSAKEPIQGPNQVGAFPDAPSRSRVPPVVGSCRLCRFHRVKPKSGMFSAADPAFRRSMTGTGNWDAPQS